MNDILIKLWIKKFALYDLWYYKGLHSPNLAIYKPYFDDDDEFKKIEEYFKSYPVLEILSSDINSDDINNFKDEIDIRANKNNDLLDNLKRDNDDKIKALCKSYEINTIEAHLYAAKEFFLLCNSYEETAYTLIAYFSDKYNDFSEDQKSLIYKQWKNELEDYKKRDSIEKDGEIIPFTYIFWNKALESPQYIDFERYEFIKKFSFLGFQNIIDEIYNTLNDELPTLENFQKIDTLFQLSFYRIMCRDLRNLVEQQVNLLLKKIEKDKYISIQHPELNYKCIPSIYSTAQLVKIIQSEYYLSDRYKDFITNSINWIVDNQTADGFWRPYSANGLRDVEELNIDTTIICLYILNSCGLPGTEYAKSMAKKWLIEHIGEFGIWNLRYPDSGFYTLLGYMAIDNCERNVTIPQKSDFIVKSQLLLDIAKEHFNKKTEVDYGIAIMLLQQSLEFFTYEIIYNLQGTYFKKASVLGLTGVDGALTKIDALFKEKKLLNASQPLPYKSKIEEMSYYRDEFTHKGVVLCNNTRIQEYFNAVSMFKDYCISQMKTLSITINY